MGQIQLFMDCRAYRHHLNTCKIDALKEHITPQISNKISKGQWLYFSVWFSFIIIIIVIVIVIVNGLVFLEQFL